MKAGIGVLLAAGAAVAGGIFLLTRKKAAPKTKLVDLPDGSQIEMPAELKPTEWQPYVSAFQEQTGVNLTEELVPTSVQEPEGFDAQLERMMAETDAGPTGAMTVEETYAQRAMEQQGWWNDTMVPDEVGSTGRRIWEISVDELRAALDENAAQLAQKREELVGLRAKRETVTNALARSTVSAAIALRQIEISRLESDKKELEAALQEKLNSTVAG